MTKYSIPDDHEWADEKEPDPPERGSVEVGTHYLTVNDERDCIERYNGLQWMFIVEDGTITAVDLSHYCPGPGHTDLMGFRPWGAVPVPVKLVALNALNGTEEEIVDVEATEEVAEGSYSGGDGR